MMSYLYPEDEVTFDKSGFGPLPDMLGSYAEEEGNSYFELYFEYPLFSSHERGDYNQIYVNMSDYLIEGNQVTYKPSHSREPHAFRIYKTEKQVERGIILVWARTRTADLRGNPVRRVVSNGAPVSSALRALKLASEETHPFSFTTNIQSNISFEKNQTNVLDALAGEEESILAITGGQMIRSNNNIYIGINESSKNVVEFRLGKNIEGISYEVDYSNVVTAVIPFYTQTYKLVDDIRDEIVRDSSGKIVKNADGTTKYNRTIGKKRESLDNEVIVYGDTVFSQYANDYSTPFYSFVEIRDDREDTGVDKDPLPPFTKTDINNRAVDWFDWEENLGVDEPEVSVKVDVHDISQSSEYSHNVNLAKLETLNVFDKALVYVPEVGIDMDMEINYIRYDGVAEKNLEVRLGTTLTSLTETVLSPQQRAFNERVQQLDREIEKSLMSSDGKSRVYWMATKPTGSFEIGDLWFDISLDGGIYVWDGYDWVAKLPPEFGKLIEESVNNAIEAAESAMQEAQTKADKALLDAKAYADAQDKLITQQVTASVNTAISTADAAKVAAKTNADQALADAKAHAIAQDKLITQQVNTSVGTAISTAEAAKVTAESSYTNAVAEAERLVGVQTTAFNTKFEENTAAMGTLSQAAKDADTKAQSALTKAGTNANLLATHQTTLNTINTTTIPAVNKAAADAMSSAGLAMEEAKKADGKIADYVTTNGLVNGTTVDSKINTATGEISKKITTVEGKVDNLSVDGINVYQRTEELSPIQEWSNRYVSITTYDIPELKANIGKKATLSFDIVLNDDGIEGRQIRLYHYQGSGLAIGITKIITPTKVKTRYKFTGDILNNPIPTGRSKGEMLLYDSTGTNSFTVSNIKIEIGEGSGIYSLPLSQQYTQSEFQIFESTYDENVKGINSSLKDLSTKKLDGKTYTDFYTNEYKKTAQGVTDAWTAVNKIVDKDGNTTDTFAKAVYDKNATRQSSAFTAVTKDLVTTATYSSGIKGVTDSITSVRGDLDKLSIGGENLIVKNTLQGGYVTSAGKFAADGGRANTATDWIEIGGAKELTFTTYDAFEGVYTGRVVLYSDKNESNFISTPVSYSSTSPIQSYTFEVPTNAKYARATLIYGDTLRYKLERGNVSTDWSPSITDQMGKAEFQIFKTDYEKNDQSIKSRLLAIDSTAEGSVVTRLNKTESTAKGNTTTISNIKTKPGEQITGYQTIKDRSDLYERVIGSANDATVKQNMARIVMTDKSFQTEIVDKQDLLTAMSSGTGMTPDPYFNKGNNRLTPYDNGSTGTISISRVNTTETGIPMPKGSGYRVAIVHGSSTATTPGRGGIYHLGQSWANGTVVVKFVAFLDKGRSFRYANNPLGDNYEHGWLTDNQGTGDWETYIYYYRFGKTGNFSSFGHLYVDGTGSGFTWFLSEYDMININETVASKVTQLSDSWSMKLTKADDVVTQINATSAGVVIQGKNIQLDGNVSMTSTFSVPNANIKDLAVNKITGTNAQFTTMITKGLTADVITSTMIKADAALFDMLFASTLATTRLAAQNAWITNAAISSLDAAKITTGTIAAARINASAVVTAGLTANVVKSTHIESSTGLIDKIFATDALITHLTSKTIFATNVKAITIDASKITSGTIAAGRINAALVVSTGLVADVVKSTHIAAGTALVDKIFSATAYITQLTSKTAFISSIQAINISATKITSGTLDASKVTVKNLDASSITANQANLVKAGLTSSSGGTLALSGDRFLSTASDGSQTYIQNGIVGTRNPDGATVGQIGYMFSGSSPVYTMRTSLGSHFSLNQTFNDTYNGVTTSKDKETIKIMAGGTQYINRAERMDLYGNVYFQQQVRINGANNLTMSGGDIINPYRISLQYGGKLWSVSGNSDFNISSTTRLWMHSNGSVAYYIDSGYMYLERHLSMQGRNITNQSDRRLKHDIKNTSVTALQNIKSLEFVDFKWNSNNSDGYGLIAQDSLSLMEYDQQNDVYMINSSKQLMMTSQAVKELAIQTDSKIEQLEAKITTLEKELATLKGAA